MPGEVEELKYLGSPVSADFFYAVKAAMGRNHIRTNHRALVLALGTYFDIDQTIVDAELETTMRKLANA